MLNCCLGFYTWEFGKLKLGCRINASAVDDYGLGNTLFQTLKLTPIQAAFEHLVLSYRRCRLPVPGQHRRILRQEPRRLLRPRRISAHQPDAFGGLLNAEPGPADRRHAHARGSRRGTYTEWRDARMASWQTTLLGLGNEVGQVVSMTHPEIPGLARHLQCERRDRDLGEWRQLERFRLHQYRRRNGFFPAEKDALINGTQVTITAVSLDGDGNVLSLTTSPACRQRQRGFRSR